ncbi:hypothetical protein H6764_01600 [Candidatus Nomurabacteria bacterium]|nr:hypothetical protein [Candidatus Nomurabacteria bacterium]
MQAQSVKNEGVENAQTFSPVFADADLTKYNSLLKLTAFVIQDFFFWWYIQMPIFYLQKYKRTLQVVNDQLSLGLLVKSFLVPWHRDYKFVGYFIGISMRVLYIPIAFTAFMIVVVGYAAFIFGWILLPLLSVVMVILSPLIK